MASSQYRDEGKIIHVELIRGQFHVRKKRRIRKTAKNIHYIMKRLHRPRLWSPPRYLCLLFRHYIKTEENACHSNFKTNMTTVISWEIIERWVTISKMKLTFVATELKYLMHFFHCNYVDSYWSRTMFNEFMYLRQLKVHIALFLIFCENARTCIDMR